MTDILPDISVISLWLVKHGSIILLVLLSLGILALPFPEETLMVVAGVLMHKQKLAILPTMLSAYIGTIMGITMSYLLGRTLGNFLVRKYGPLLKITHDRFEKAHRWFERFGGWLLTFGYFIPGVRHVTGFSAGISEMMYKKFALYAYIGAIGWVSFFLTFGYFAGNYFFDVISHLEKIDLVLVALIGIFLLILILVFIKRFKEKYF